MRGWILEMEPLSLISVFWLFVGAVIFLLFLPCRAAASMRGRRLYLSPNGRDTNPGSLDAPCATLDKASREACPGDAIILLPGTYNDVFAPVRGGTAEAPILLQAAKIGTAKLVPPDGAAALLLENVSHIWIRGVHVSPASTGVWARITDASHIRIEDSLFENSRSGTPFVIRRCSQIRIVGNEFRQWSRDWKTTDPAGINMVVVYDSSHLLFEGNAFGAALHTGLQFRPEGRNDHVVAPHFPHPE